MKRTTIEELRKELKEIEEKYEKAKERVKELNEELEVARALKKDLLQRRETLRYLIGKRKGRNCPALKIWNGIYRCYARKGLQVAPNRDEIYSYYCYKCRFSEDEIRVRLLAYNLGERE